MELSMSTNGPEPSNRLDSAPAVRTPSGQRSAFYEKLICQGILILGCIAMGWLATRLNNHFYSSNQPFFDSLDYHFRTHQVMKRCQEQGLISAVKFACVDVTVCLPFLIAAFAGLVFEPSRHVGIWIQTFELTCFCLTAWQYFAKTHRLSPVTSLALTAPFFLLRCLYMNNGGLSDYRMDLSLAILFATTCLWYLIASRGEEQWPYWLLGISCAATCLFRGTAPVYFVIALGPVFLWDLILRRRDKTHLQGIAIAFTLAVVLSIWFYVLNFKTLYYYYFVWNTDANAHLPLAQSIRHFSFVYHHIGSETFLFVMVFHLLVVFSRLQSRFGKLGESKDFSWRDFVRFDYRLLWVGLAPALFLTLRGAGLNPFVCMPSVLGLLLFALIPNQYSRGHSLNRTATGILLVVFLVCGLKVVQRGWKSHDGESPHSMAAHQQTLDTILNDMQQNNAIEARFATSHSYFLNTHSLTSVAVFDRVGARQTSDAIKIEDATLRPDGVFSLSAEADWARTPGGTDDEKLHLLATKVCEELDYIILPTAECSAMLRDRVAHNVINRYAVRLREELLSKGNWDLISEEICNRADETVQIYRNNRVQSAQRVSTIR